ncbi:MAG TPA: methyltransferase domain-containing protein [Pseudonocardiaceae bacterium]
MPEDAQCLPAALARALPLLRTAPEAPDVSRGYLDLLGGQDDAAPGPVQALWESRIGAGLYAPATALLRRLLTFTRLPDSVARLPAAGRALDVGCGPGDVTAALGRAAGPNGLALGVDISVPMLQRAVGKQADNVGFLRADAQRLPFHEAGFDLVTCLAALQLVPAPARVLTEMARVLAPGGHLVLMIPTVRGGLIDRVAHRVGHRAGLQFFDPDRLAEDLHSRGIATVHTHRHGPLLWVLAGKASRAAPPPARRTPP